MKHKTYTEHILYCSNCGQIWFLGAYMEVLALLASHPCDIFLSHRRKQKSFVTFLHERLFPSPTPSSSTRTTIASLLVNRSSLSYSPLQKLAVLSHDLFTSRHLRMGYPSASIHSPPFPLISRRFPLRRNAFYRIYAPQSTLLFRCCSTLSAEPAAVFHHRLALDVGSAVIPHPEKVLKGGEDSFFISDYNGGILGVADGVSGWAEENVDPALFSRELMFHALEVLGTEQVGSCPRKILAKAHEATSAIGAATAIIAVLESKDNILHIANLGDCGLRLIREGFTTRVLLTFIEGQRINDHSFVVTCSGKVVFATSAQQHYFDCPYQLSSEQGAQTANDAKVYSTNIKKGDIIIIGSDGLFDNVYDKDIEEIVAYLELDGVHAIATALASRASKNANDAKYESPYSREAVLQGYDLPFWKKILGQKFTGGKLDDITILAARVISAEKLGENEEITSGATD